MRLFHLHPGGLNPPDQTEQETDLKSEKEIVLAYQEAHNAHDIDKALGFFSPNIRFMMIGLWTREGLEELRNMEAWDAAMNSRLIFDGLKVRQGRMDCRGTETNDWYQFTGIQQVTFDSIKFEFKDDQIALVRAKMSPKSERAIDQVVNDVVRWALDAAPDEVAALVPRSVLRYGHEEALRWMALLKEWKSNVN